MANIVKAKRILIAVAAGIIVSVLLFFTAIKPSKLKIIKLQKEHAEVLKLLETSRSYIDRYRSVKDAYASLYTQWEELSTYLPEEDEMPGLLREIANAGESSKMTFFLFKPLDVKPGEDFYMEAPVQIRVKCNYHEFGDFLSKIASMKRLVNVDNLTLVSSKKKKEEIIPDKFMEADFIATAYTTPSTIRSATTKKTTATETRKPVQKK